MLKNGRNFDLNRLVNFSEKLKEFPKKEQKAFWFFTSCILTMTMGFIDFQSVPELSFKIYYLIPVFLAAWFTGKLGGYVIVLFCAFFWFVDTNLYAMHYGNNTLTSYWNVFLKIGFFAAFVSGMVAIKIVLSWLEKKRFKYFAIYCFVLGLVAIIF